MPVIAIFPHPDLAVRKATGYMAGMGLFFRKMHGLGNDFVVIDGRDGSFALNPDQRAALADRRRGIGCDQLIVIAPPRDPAADATMLIYNPDGGEAGACGNATRCVADLLMRESGRPAVTIETVAGLLPARAAAGGLVCVDMGAPRLGWQEIPLAKALNPETVVIDIGPFLWASCVSMGNPHAVFFVEDAEAAPLERYGRTIETLPIFPDRTNVEAVQVLAPDRIRMRVWERGAGITQACGSGACAALVATARRGLTGRRATVVLDGGALDIEWRADGHVEMTGPTALAFTGEIPAEMTR